MDNLEILVKIVEMIYKIVSVVNTGGRFVFFLRKECEKHTLNENVDETKSTSPAGTEEVDTLHE